MSNTHINTGIRKILEYPFVYNLFGTITGGKRRRKNHANKYFNLKSGEKVLDIGCGNGALLNYLCKGVEYHGFDMQKEYIDFAKKKFGTKGNFYCEPVGKTFNPNWENYFDAVNADGILHHLNEDDSLKLLQTAYFYLKKGGKLITIDPVYYQNQRKLLKYIISKDRGQNIRTDYEYLELANSTFLNVSSNISNKYFLLPYSYFVMELKK